MSRARILVYSLLALSLIFTSACGRSSDARAEIQQGYDAMNGALKAREVDKFMAVLTPDFQQISLDKTTFKRDKIEEMTRAVTKEAVDIDSKAVIEQIALTGDRADVTVTVIQKQTVKEPTSDKTHVVEITATMQDVWKKDKDGWKMLQSTETKHAATRDGQPLPASGTATKK